MDIVVVTVVLIVVVVSVAKSGGRRSDTSRRAPGTVQRTARRPLTPARTPEPKHPPMPDGRVLKGRAWVIDGDTIAIKGMKIRLAGIDAPELDMPWGQKAKWAMVDICKGQVITARLNGERSFDRLVGTCYLPDGRDIGGELVKRGLALDLPHFSGGKYRPFEPKGARQRLANGRFGHASIRRRAREGSWDASC